MKDKDIFDRIMSTRLLRPFFPFYEKHREALLYLFFGGLTTLVNILIYALCTGLVGMGPLVANVFAWIGAVAFAYVTNRVWVFQSGAETSAERLKELFSFYTGRLATLGLEEAILWLFVTRMGLNSMAVKIVAQIAVIIGNYFISKLFVFKKKD